MVRGVEKFKEIIEQVADDTGCAAVVIEKDYYVTMIKIPENVFLVFCAIILYNKLVKL